MPDFLPAADSPYREWAQAFFSYAAAHAEELQLDPADVDAAIDAFNLFVSDLQAHVEAQALARARCAGKDQSRKTSVELIRNLARKIRANGEIPDAARAALGIGVPDRIKTLRPPPATAPLGLLESSGRLTHTLRICDSATPTRTAKPDGVLGAEVLCKIGGDAPVGDEGLTSLGIATRPRFTATFEGGDGTRIAYYLFRWIGNKGEKGPLSRTLSATIAA